MAGVTIHQVAEHAGVSVKTVSRVVNDESNVRIEVRERVRAAADALGYRPNVSARRLRGFSSELIVALVDAPLTLDHLRGEHGGNFLDRFQLGAMIRCREAGFHLMVELVELGDPEVYRQVQKMLTSLRPDGVILTAPICDDLAMLDLLEEMATRYVRMGPEHQVERGQRVYMDDFEAAYRMAGYLIELGHRDIGFIVGSPRYSAARLRLDGFRAALRDAALPVRDDWIKQGDFTFTSGLQCVVELLQGDRPSAIFASNDEMALGAMHAAARLDLMAPRDLSVVGFDDIGSARFSLPPLTTVRQPVTEMSLAAADILISQSAAKGELRAHGDARLDFELIVRASAGPPPS